VALGSIALLALALWGGADAWAAPVAERMNQTVPGRTPTSEPTPVPSVTPTAPPAATNTPQPTNTPGPTDTPPPNAMATPTADANATSTPTPTATATVAVPTTVPDFGLLLQMESAPALVMQGDEVEVRFVVTNPGDVAAVNVQVRNEVPPALILVESSVDGGEATAETNSTGVTILHLTWPSLAAGGQTEAIVRFTVAANTADGAIIDNLAVAWADNAAAHTAGLSIGMPPALLPTFD